jgi:hypothetical protein
VAHGGRGEDRLVKLNLGRKATVIIEGTYLTCDRWTHEKDREKVTEKQPKRRLRDRIERQLTHQHHVAEQKHVEQSAIVLRRRGTKRLQREVGS